MADFSLTNGTDTLDFDIQGNVTRAGASFGAWTVADDAQISVTDNTGTTTTIPVVWQFNTGNQLELRQSGNVVFNFHANANVRPDLQVANGVLHIAPDQNGVFFFSLHGDWSMDNQFNLIFTVASVKSTINGILRDTDSSEFIYIFITQGPVARNYELDFTGKWEQNGSGLDVDFRYDKDGGASGTIQLPPGLTMDPVKNILVYTYNKGTHKGSLELAGSIRVNSNFSVTYVLDQQDQAGIQSTTFSLAAQIKTDTVGEGNLHLLIQRTDGSQTIEIGGDYHGAIAGLDLTVGFNYKRTVSGTTIHDSVAFDGKVVNPNNGNQFTWNFEMGGNQISVDITAHITLRSGACLNASLTFNISGQQVGITAMFGISTNCGAASAANPSSLLLAPKSTARKATLARLTSVI
ncbi:MAG TPA: hypothetical protein VK738_02140 [Terriglobales bacterium]|jgi:hypothetical protein|nr:hypothetical protein [Terriglobales bacterium]